MSVVVERRDLRDCRNAVISLFARNGFSYTGHLFDWYYSNAVSQPPICWILRDRGSTKIVGICSVVRRTIHWDGTELAAGVPGDLVVDADSRSSFGGIELVRCVQSLVQQEELDVLIGVPSMDVLPLAERMGFRRLSVWESYAQIVNSRAALRLRLGRVGAAFSPFVDVQAALFRALKTRSAPHFDVVELSRQRLAQLETDKWSFPARSFVLDTSLEFLRWRFLDTPIAAYRIFGIVDSKTGHWCGYVVGTPADGKLVISDCRTDARILQEADALINLFRYCQNEGCTVAVESLRSSSLSQELRALGFIKIPPRRGHHSPWLVGYWRSDHKLAQEFAEPALWKLFRGVQTRGQCV